MTFALGWYALHYPVMFKLDSEGSLLDCMDAQADLRAFTITTFRKDTFCLGKDPVGQAVSTGTPDFESTEPFIINPSLILIE